MTDSNVDVENVAELFTRTPIANSPFMLVKTDDGYFCCLGLYRLSELYETADEALAFINDKSWNNIINVGMIISEIMKNKTLSDFNSKY
jgi:hypothetical protein